MKKKIYLCFAACSVLSCVLIGCSPEKRETAATVANGGFESGKVEPWAPFLDSKPAIASIRPHSGEHDLALSGDGDGSVSQDVKGLEEGKEYTVSGWASADSTATAMAQMSLWDPETKAVTHSILVAPQTTWTPLSVSFKASRSGIVRIHLYKHSGAGTIYWDDVQIAKK